MPHLDLSDDEAAALIRLLRKAIDGDHYPLSPPVQTLQAVLNKLRPLSRPRAPATAEGVRADARGRTTPTVKSWRINLTLGTCAEGRLGVMVSGRSPPRGLKDKVTPEPDIKRGGVLDHGQHSSGCATCLFEQDLFIISYPRWPSKPE